MSSVYYITTLSSRHLFLYRGFLRNLYISSNQPKKGRTGRRIIKKEVNVQIKLLSNLK